MLAYVNWGKLKKKSSKNNKIENQKMLKFQAWEKWSKWLHICLWESDLPEFVVRSFLMVLARAMDAIMKGGEVFPLRCGEEWLHSPESKMDPGPPVHNLMLIHLKLEIRDQIQQRKSFSPPIPSVLAYYLDFFFKSNYTGVIVNYRFL